MKKFFISSLFILGFIIAGHAQRLSPNALGFRLGGGEGFGPEISYQYALESSNRLEFDLGLRNNSEFSAFKITALYQWVWHIDQGFNWYAGVGPGLGSVRDKREHKHNDGVFINIAGDIGIEYNFDNIPLQLSLDFRPEFAFINYDVYSSFGPDFAIGIRYLF